MKTDNNESPLVQRLTPMLSDIREIRQVFRSHNMELLDLTFIVDNRPDKKKIEFKGR